MGTGDDPEGKSGLASLTATLLDQGTARRTATELAEAFEQLGASVRVGAGRDDTGVGVSVLARNLEPTLDLLAEMLESPRFDPKDFDRERTQQLADLLQGPDDVSWLAGRALPVVMFGPDHPYGKPAEGYPETVKALTLDDVRAFHASGFGPKGATLIVTGDVDPDAVTHLLEQTLGRWRGSNSGPRPRPAAAVKPEPGVIFLVDKPGAVQSVINVGRHWVDRSDPRYVATLVGNHLLGADFLSRLNKNLREDHGYTYGAGSGIRLPPQPQHLARLDLGAGRRHGPGAPGDPQGAGRPGRSEADHGRGDRDGPLGRGAELSRGIRVSLGHRQRPLRDRRVPPAGRLPRDLPAQPRARSPAEIQKSMTEVVAPADRFILIVGDRKTVEPALKKAGFTKIKVITYDGKPVEK